jgi:hypothetical protein
MLSNTKLQTTIRAPRIKEVVRRISCELLRLESPKYRDSKIILILDAERLVFIIGNHRDQVEIIFDNCLETKQNDVYRLDFDAVLSWRVFSSLFQMADILNLEYIRITVSDKDFCLETFPVVAPIVQRLVTLQEDLDGEGDMSIAVVHLNENIIERAASKIMDYVKPAISPSAAPITVILPSDVNDNNVEVPEDDNCKVCFEKKAITVNLPCGHVVYCLACTHRCVTADKHECPVCRANITEVKRIYK